MMAITAVDRKSLPLTRNEVKPKSSKKPPRTVQTIALKSVLFLKGRTTHIEVSLSSGIILCGYDSQQKEYDQSRESSYIHR